MNRFILEENIKRFSRMLNGEQHESRRRQIENLLLEERTKLCELDNKGPPEHLLGNGGEGGGQADEQESMRTRLAEHARYCHLRAEELRSAASCLANPGAAEALMRLANDYDLMTARARAALEQSEVAQRGRM